MSVIIESCPHVLAMKEGEDIPIFRAANSKDAVTCVPLLAEAGHMHKVGSVESRGDLNVKQKDGYNLLQWLAYYSTSVDVIKSMMNDYDPPQLHVQEII